MGCPYAAHCTDRGENSTEASTGGAPLSAVTTGAALAAGHAGGARPAVCVGGAGAAAGAAGPWHAVADTSASRANVRPNVQATA